MARPRNAPRYPRTARLNELVREIVAEELERLDDDRLELVAVTSVHVDPAGGWFPHLVGYADERGGGAGEGWTHNEPLPAGTADEPWLAALDRLLATVEAHGSDALVVSLGVDAAVDDPAAPLMITPAGFRAAGERLGGLRLPTVFVQEGGYDLTRLAGLVLDVLTGFESSS